MIISGVQMTLNALPTEDNKWREVWVEFILTHIWVWVWV